MRLHAPFRTLSVPVLALALLSACGGGGDEAGTGFSAPPEGAYSGSLSGSASSEFRMLLLENNEVWTLYGTPFGSAFLANGFVQGAGVVSSNVYTTTNAKDFGFVPGEAITASASYTGAGVINGSLRTPAGGAASFSGTQIPATVYSYTATPAVANLVGTWTSNNNGVATTVTITAGGVVTGSNSVSGVTCAFSGTVTTRGSGKNVYNVVVDFGAGGCRAEFANQRANGIAITYGIGGVQNQLLVGVVNVARTVGASLALVK